MRENGESSRKSNSLRDRPTLVHFLNREWTQMDANY